MLLDLSPESHIDSSGLHILNNIIVSYEERGIQLLLSNPSLSVMEAFLRSKLVDEIGRQHIFVSTHDAVKWSLGHMDALAVSTPITEEVKLESKHPKDVEAQCES